MSHVWRSHLSQKCIYVLFHINWLLFSTFRRYLVACIFRAEQVSLYEAAYRGTKCLRFVRNYLKYSFNPDEEEKYYLEQLNLMKGRLLISFEALLILWCWINGRDTCVGLVMQLTLLRVISFSYDGRTAMIFISRCCDFQLILHLERC